jgi:anti-sigma regulatory factor (Ser/Thr protein kinase)
MTTEPRGRGIYIAADDEVLGEQLSTARLFVKEAASDFGFPSSEIESITLAVHEAVANAVVHGGPRRDGADGTVELRIWQEHGVAVFCVCDGGTLAPASEARGGLLDEHGRGLPLMKALMDGVELVPEPDRTVVRLEKRLEPAAA